MKSSQMKTIMSSVLSVNAVILMSRRELGIPSVSLNSHLFFRLNYANHVIYTSMMISIIASTAKNAS